MSAADRHHRTSRARAGKSVKSVNNNEVVASFQEVEEEVCMATSLKVDNPLQQLLACGQSYWLDNLTQHMIASGELKGWIQDHGLRGITANPTTFREALSSSDYDRHIESLTHEGRSTKDIYETLLIHDVQQACDFTARRIS